MFAVSKGLLTHFSPVLRQQLVMDQKKVIIFERADKRSVSWVLRWMIAGGIDKTVTPPETLQDDHATMELLLNRLQIVDELRITRLCEELSRKLMEHFDKVSITPAQIRWAYSHPLALTPNGLRSSVADGILHSVLDYDLVYSLDMFKTEPRLYHDMVTKIDTPETIKRVGAIQRNWPLSVEQIQFLYEFCVYQGHLRKTISHGLLELLDAGDDVDHEIYRCFARRNDDFEHEMNAAIERKQRAADHAAYLERQARREAQAAVAKVAAPQKKQQSAASSVPNGVGNKGSVIARGAKGAKGIKASGVTRVAPTPVKPAGRLQSDVILRLDKSGMVTREMKR